MINLKKYNMRWYTTIICGFYSTLIAVWLLSYVFPQISTVNGAAFSPLVLVNSSIILFASLLYFFKPFLGIIILSIILCLNLIVALVKNNPEASILLLCFILIFAVYLFFDKKAKATIALDLNNGI